MSHVLSPPSSPGWTFLSNYSHVLICLVQDPKMRMRDVAIRVGITERAVQRIIAELEVAGVLTRTRDGRQNTYEIDRKIALRHPLEAHRTVGDLLGALLPKTEVSVEQSEQRAPDTPNE